MPRARPSGCQLRPGLADAAVRSATFDAVVAASVLEYVDSPAAVLGECARVLRPGGVMLCTVPDLAHPVRWLEWAAAAARPAASRSGCAGRSGPGSAAT